MLGAMRDSGVELVAVSAEPQGFVDEIMQKHNLGFKVSQSSNKGLSGVTKAKNNLTFWCSCRIMLASSIYRLTAQVLSAQLHCVVIIIIVCYFVCFSAILIPSIHCATTLQIKGTSVL